MSNPSSQGYDAIVVGAGPNGLSAAITLAQAGCKVLVLEGKETIGGGARTAELTLPGFWHDVCSAIHPLGAGSPFFNSLPLAEYGLEWIYPPVPFAHPLDDGPAVLSHHSIQETAAGLAPDTAAYQRLMAGLIRDWNQLEPNLWKRWVVQSARMERLRQALRRTKRRSDSDRLRPTGL